MDKIKRLIQKYVKTPKARETNHLHALPTRKTMKAWKRDENRGKCKRNITNIKADKDYVCKMKVIRTSIMYCDPEACKTLSSIGDDALMVYFKCMDDPKTRKEIYEVCKTCQEGFTHQINR